MSRAYLMIEDAVCAFGAKNVLDGITFQVERGEIIGIIGPNGSGKSTLLSAISRVLRPVRGRILLQDRDLRFLNQIEVAQKMAFVSQDESFDVPFRTEEAVLMGRFPHFSRFRREDKEDLKAVREAMEATGTLSLAGRSVTELSGGEKQRILLARSLAQAPEVLILDEPTSHLDIGYAIEFLNLLSDLRGSGNLTVIMALHDLNLASLYCDRLILLDRGRIHAVGSPGEVITVRAMEEVYRTLVMVISHPVYHRPQVILMPCSFSSRTGRRSLEGSDELVGGGSVGIRP